MPSIEDAAAQLLSADVPILLLDTCTLLDVIRAPFRKDRYSPESASTILDMTNTSPPTCSLVCASPIKKEWGNNHPNTLDELQQHINKMEAHALLFHQISSSLGVSPPFILPQFLATEIDKRLNDIAHSLLTQSIHLEADYETTNKMYRRVTSGKRPSNIGKPMDDCDIFEQYLKLCSILRANGFLRKIVFCTSNTEDYCEAKSKAHPDIDMDCKIAGIAFTSRLNWALSELTTPP